MSARRDPEGRWPVGPSILLMVLVAGLIWAGIASVLAVTVLRAGPEIHQGESYEAE